MNNERWNFSSALAIGHTFLCVALRSPDILCAIKSPSVSIGLLCHLLASRRRTGTWWRLRAARTAANAIMDASSSAAMGSSDQIHAARQLTSISCGPRKRCVRDDESGMERIHNAAAMLSLQSTGPLRQSHQSLDPASTQCSCSKALLDRKWCMTSQYSCTNKSVEVSSPHFQDAVSPVGTWRPGAATNTT
jgi:hypothetical protein